MAYRRRQATRSAVIAVVSTVVVVVGVAVGITSTPGWPRVRETFFDPAGPGRRCPPWRPGCGSTSG